MKKIIAVLMAALMMLASATIAEEIPTGVEDGILTVAMECAYAPYNWAQPDESNDAVPIKDTMLYANGYDVMTAKAICEANGWQLEILQLEWDSLIPAVQSGMCDAVIAGQSMTAERMESVDFAGPYLYASIVCLTRKNCVLAEAKGISDLAGAKGASQNSTIWYDIYMPQIKDVDALAAESAPAMLMALVSGTVDFVCTDMPTAQAALLAFPDLVLLDFTGGEDNFVINDEDVNIGISVRKGNTFLKDAIDSYLKDKTADDFNKLMDEAIRIQPLSE